MTTRVLSALAYRAAMRLVSIEDLPLTVARHTRLLMSMSATERADYLYRAQGLTRVEADEQVRA